VGYEDSGMAQNFIACDRGQSLLLPPDAEARGATEVAQLLRQNLEQEKHALEIALTTMKTIANQGIAVASA
jgi:ferritin-like metal-binding protein YciE